MYRRVPTGVQGGGASGPESPVTPRRTRTPRRMQDSGRFRRGGSGAGQKGPGAGRWGPSGVAKSRGREPRGVRVTGATSLDPRIP